MQKLFRLSLLATAGAFAASAAVDTGLLALVPSDSKIITSVDVARARWSDFGQYLLQRISMDDQVFQDLAQQTGFDPRRDLQDFMFASRGPTGDKAHPRFAILARGNFDPDRIAAAAKVKGVATESYQDVTVFVNPSNRPRTAFAFPDTGIAVFGDLDTVHEIIANRSNPTSLDAALQQLVDNAGKDNDAWFASSIPGASLAPHFHEGAKHPTEAPAQALQSVSQSSGGIRFGASIQLSLDAITRSVKDAQALADVIRFMTSMVQMQAQKAQSVQQAQIIAPALTNMTVATNGNVMHLSMSLPEKTLEQLADSGAAVNTHPAKPTTR